MLDSIFIGMTGLNGFSRGLKVIANNTANMNTPGFKSGSLNFASLYYAGTADGGHGSTNGTFGHGLNTLGTSLNFGDGEVRQSGNGLDLAIDGNGFFALQIDEGTIRYTRAGQFEFDGKGVLREKTSGAKVLGSSNTTGRQPITLDGLKTNAPHATTKVDFVGALSTGSSDHTVNGVKVLDAAGGEHQLTVKFAAQATPGSWTVTLQEGLTTVGTATLTFVSGAPTDATKRLSFTFAPAAAPTQTLTLDFGTDVSSFAAGTSSTLAVDSQDGYGVGSLTGATFDAAGQLKLSYSNGQIATGPKLMLGRMESEAALRPVGTNLFEVADEGSWQTGFASSNGFGAIQAGAVEMSNVNLTQEFSDLVIVQRGYQASSQVVSTANEMLQELFNMKSK